VAASFAAAALDAEGFDAEAVVIAIGAVVVAGCITTVVVFGAAVLG
jgi:hypothetical protein